MPYPSFHPGRSRPSLHSWQRLLIVGTVLAMVFSTHLTLPAGVEAAAHVATADVALRSGPGPEFEALLTIPAGSTVEVTGEPENGYLPVIFDDVAGYAAAEYLAAGDAVPEPSSAESGPTGTRYVTGGDLNLRSGPGTTSSVLLVMPDGAAVELTGQVANEFAEVTWNGTTGWAVAQFLGTDPPATESAPATDPTVAPETASTPASGNDATEETTSFSPQALQIGDTPVGTATVVTGGLSLNMRSGPGTTFGVIRSIPNGATVDVMGASDAGFLPVRYQGSEGWSSANYLRTGATAPTPTATATPVTPTPGTGQIGDTPVGTATVITDGLSLNMRSGPGTTYGVIRSIPSGATVDVMGAAQNGFLPVRYSGTKGWASATWLRAGSVATPTSTPVTPTATPATPTSTPATPTSTPGGIGDTPVGSATVITDGLSLNLRSGPGTTFGVIRSIPSGATVDVMGAAQNGFLPVRYAGTKGWASAAWLRVGATTPTPTATASPTPTATPVTPTSTPVTPTATPTGTPGGIGDTPVGVATVNTGGLSLYMRSGPGSTFSPIRTIPNGATVDVMGVAQNGYLPVRYQGTKGWSSATYLRVGSGTPTPTATATTTPTVTPTATPVTPTPTTTPVDPNNPPIGDMAIGKATINATVSLRRGPGTSYTHVQTLNSGWKVEIMGSEVNGWTPIRYNAAKGWVPSSNLTAGWGWPIVDQMITPSRSIPMYSTPGGPTLVVQVPPGTLVDITGAAQGTWVPARWAGYSGWMDASRMYQPEDFVDPGPANAQEAEMIALIYQAADKWGQSRADMLRVARCESALDPNVVNPRSGTSGLFQFMPSTFAFTPNGKRGENIFDPWSNADAAGWMWANGMRHHWACQ